MDNFEVLGIHIDNHDLQRLQGVKKEEGLKQAMKLLDESSMAAEDWSSFHIYTISE
jgi:hypothetical protein